MLKPRTILAVILLAMGATGLRAQQRPTDSVEIEALSKTGMVEYDPRTDIAIATNGVLVRYGGAVIVAERALVNRATGEVEADGQVRIQRDDMVWVGEHIRYNIKTRQIEAQQFRTGKTPVYVSGSAVQGDTTNQVYYATNVFVTTDDYSQPFQKVRARRLKIVAGDHVEAKDAVLYLGDVPVFYFPYYSRKLSEEANQFLFTPGYRTAYGAFLLNTYTWFLNEQFSGAVHLDYRSKRGLGAGADVKYELGRWGDGLVKYYYLNDQDPENNPRGQPYPNNRQIFWFEYQSTPWTNLSVKSAVRYESDSGVLKEFFQRLYEQNPQPSTFFDVEKFWENWSLETYVQPRVNDFFETVERLPEVKLNGYRQQLGASPLYYESVSSFGYYERLFPEQTLFAATNFSAFRGDTFQQLLLPQTFFGWLNVTPRMGGRFTYYSEATGPGATTSEEYRGVFNVGGEVSFKASRVWPGAHNKLFDVNGLRHIFEPAVTYAFVPEPNVLPSQLPQFDYQTPSLMLLPITYPGYNAIDAIDSQNTFRFGMRNKLQTKRADGVDNVVNWDIFTDWLLHPKTNQTTFSDVYSALVIKPRSWLSLESETRFNINTLNMNLSRQTLTLSPNNTWSWGFTYYYLRQELPPPPTQWGIGSQILSSTFYYRFNENWGLRSAHYYDVAAGKLTEQAYSIYRDMRSWTMALIFRVLEPTNGENDYTVALTFSLKAKPRYSLGEDAVGRYGLLGY